MSKLRLTQLVLLTSLLALPFPLHAQGCAQCQDNTAATSSATQRAYRHAIILMTVTAGGLFVGTLFLFRRPR
jgi:hypothetical protein